MICIKRKVCRVCGSIVGAFATTLSAYLLVVPTIVVGTSKQAVAAVVLPVARMRGGVVYDPAVPLNAVVTPKFDARDPSIKVLTYAVTFTGANGETVPALFVTPAGAKHVPTIVIMHGLGSSKEQMLPLASALASNGYASLAIDAVGHGARPKVGGKAATDLDLPQWHQLCAQTIADLGHAVDFLQTRDEVDPHRIGYLGISLGAILGGVFIADEPRIKGAMLWAGGGDWGLLISTTAISGLQAKRSAAGSNADAASIEKVMADIDPVDTIHAFSPRPLLFINGDKDTIVPPACTKELFAAAGEPKTRVVLPGGHLPDVFLMGMQSLAWANAHIKPQLSP